ncbi:MAG: hypothetical protein HYY40_14000 [Bacteroidetes bacterium]|nr:hypothetical protein [Bacteroidota bacterium]
MSKENENKNQEPKIQLKPMTPKELALLYGVTKKTFASWKKAFQKELGPLRGRIYTIKQVKIILENLGIPGIYTEK